MHSWREVNRSHTICRMKYAINKLQIILILEKTSHYLPASQFRLNFLNISWPYYYITFSYLALSSFQVPLIWTPLKLSLLHCSLIPFNQSKRNLQNPSYNIPLCALPTPLFSYFDLTIRYVHLIWSFNRFRTKQKLSYKISLLLLSVLLDWLHLKKQT